MSESKVPPEGARFDRPDWQGEQRSDERTLNDVFVGLHEDKAGLEQHISELLGVVRERDKELQDLRVELDSTTNALVHERQELLSKEEEAKKASYALAQADIANQDLQRIRKRRGDAFLGGLLIASVLCSGLGYYFWSDSESRAVQQIEELGAENAAQGRRIDRLMTSLKEAASLSEALKRQHLEELSKAQSERELLEQELSTLSEQLRQELFKRQTQRPEAQGHDDSTRPERLPKKITSYIQFRDVMWGYPELFGQRHGLSKEAIRCLQRQFEALIAGDTERMVRYEKDLLRAFQRNFLPINTRFYRHCLKGRTDIRKLEAELYLKDDSDMHKIARSLAHGVSGKK